jgi:hypothetical protein
MSVQHLTTLQANQRQQVLDLIQRSTIFDNSPPIAMVEINPIHT